MKLFTFLLVALLSVGIFANESISELELNAAKAFAYQHAKALNDFRASLQEALDKTDYHVTVMLHDERSIFASKYNPVFQLSLIGLQPIDTCRKNWRLSLQNKIYKSIVENRKDLTIMDIRDTLNQLIQHQAGLTAFQRELERLAYEARHQELKARVLLNKAHAKSHDDAVFSIEEYSAWISFLEGQHGNYLLETLNRYLAALATRWLGFDGSDNFNQLGQYHVSYDIELYPHIEKKIINKLISSADQPTEEFLQNNHSLYLLWMETAKVFLDEQLSTKNSFIFDERCQQNKTYFNESQVRTLITEPYVLEKLEQAAQNLSAQHN